MKNIVLFIGLALCCTGALAQKKMYRCGNVFQERPCEGPKAAAPEPAKAAVDDKKQQIVSKQQERDRAAKEAKCDAWKNDLEDVQKRLKAGVTGTAARDLETRRVELNKQIGSGCA